MSAPSVFDDLLRRDHVAQRLGHLAALRIDGEAVRQHAVVGRARRASPSEVSSELTGTSRGAGPSLPDTDRPARRRRASVRCRRTQNATTPESNQTSRMSVTFSYCSASAPSSSARIEREPGIDAVRLDARATCFDQLARARMQLAGVALCDEQRDRHAPGALARDAPVRAVLRSCRRCAPRPTPGSSRHLRDVAQRAPRAGPACSMLMNHCGVARKIDRRLVAPAVRIAVRDLLVVQQHAAFAQQRDDRVVRLPDRPSGRRQIGVAADRRRRRRPD